jgi:hypothetical protein
MVTTGSEHRAKGLGYAMNFFRSAWTASDGPIEISHGRTLSGGPQPKSHQAKPVSRSGGANPETSATKSRCAGVSCRVDVRHVRHRATGCRIMTPISQSATNRF